MSLKILQVMQRYVKNALEINCYVEIEDMKWYLTINRQISQETKQWDFVEKLLQNSSHN